MAALRFVTFDSTRDALREEIGANELQPPVGNARPRWRATTLERLAERSGVPVGIDRDGDQRLGAGANPRLGGAPFATSTMWAPLRGR